MNYRNKITYSVIVLIPVGEAQWRTKKIAREHIVEPGESLLAFYKTVNTWNRAFHHSFTHRSPDNKRVPVYHYIIDPE